MTGPRTAREALIAEMLGELDALLARVEALPAQVAGAEGKVAASVAALDEAGDRYRMAVTAFTEQAKVELTEYMQRKAGEVAARTVVEQRAAIQEIAVRAFQTETMERAAGLGAALTEAAREFRRSRWARLMEHAMTALIAASFTAGAVYGILR